MVRDILDWTQKTFEDIQEESLTALSAAKAFGCGFVEGYVNSAVVIGTIAMVGLTVISALGKEITITDKKA